MNAHVVTVIPPKNLRVWFYENTRARLVVGKLLPGDGIRNEYYAKC